METFAGLRPLTDNPCFCRDRRRSLAGLDMADIDAPLRGIIDAFTQLPCCFTLQCCWGHFLTDKSQDPHTLEPIARGHGAVIVEYRIAYLALCVENSEPGRALLDDLRTIASLDPDYIQFGCAGWFWERQVNSYALQVEPVRFQDKDSVILGLDEALHVQDTRDRVFEAVSTVQQKAMLSAGTGMGRTRTDQAGNHSP